jgi:hypothetical protein
LAVHHLLSLAGFSGKYGWLGYIRRQNMIPKIVTCSPNRKMPGFFFRTPY